MGEYDLSANNTQEQLREIAEKWDREHLPESYARQLRSPGETEVQALLRIAVDAAMFGLFGIMAVGATLGTFLLPLFGTIFGAVAMACFGFMPTLVGMPLYVLSRGRVTAPSIMGWVGASTGVLCTPWPPAIGLLAPETYFSILLGLLTGFGGRWAAARSISKYHIREGVGIRSWRQFAIADLLRLTIWLAFTLTSLQLLVRYSVVSWPAAMWWFLLSTGCALIVALPSWLASWTSAEK